MYYDCYTPEDLIDMDERKFIAKMTPPNINKKAFIYLLINSYEQVVYVGQSCYHPIFRIFHHLKDEDKDFSTYSSILICPSFDKKILNDTEAELILKFKPKYNKTLPNNTLWAKQGTLLKKLDIGKIQFTKLRKKHKIEIKTFKGDFYFNIPQVKKIIGYE